MKRLPSSFSNISIGQRRRMTLEMLDRRLGSVEWECRLRGGCIDRPEEYSGSVRSNPTATWHKSTTPRRDSIRIVWEQQGGTLRTLSFRFEVLFV